MRILGFVSIENGDRPPAITASLPLRATQTAFRDLLQLARPVQWSKNVFVLAPLLFSGLLNNPHAVGLAAIALVCFGFWASAVYCVNDVLDAELDRTHPRKRFRPVAAGRVSPLAALSFALALVAFGTAVAAFSLPLELLVVGLLYLVNSISYCVLFKQRPIADVISIAIGFVLRLIAGCVAISVTATPWILVCGFFLAMYLACGKRLLELENLENASEFRPVLMAYDRAKLNMMLTTTASVCLISYLLYTVAPQTIDRHHTDKLIYTVPFVAYGIFRYLFKVQDGRNDGPIDVLMNDRTLVVNCALWVLSTVAILYVV